MNTYFSRSKLESSEYFTDMRFATEFQNYETGVAKMITETGAFGDELSDLVEVGRTQLYNFSYELLEDMLDPKYLEKHKLDTQGEKRRHFFKLLAEERARITDYIIPDSATYREETEPTRTAITEGNPYKEE